MTDHKVQAVLDIYHARIQAERADRPVERDDRLLAVGPQTGRFLNILARSLQAPRILELGTSFGYSGIWLADAARATGGWVVTLERAAHKSAYAREMAEKAGLAEWIEHLVGDAVDQIGSLPHGIDFVLVDLWKDLYEPCLDAFYPKLNPGAIIVADNMIRPGDEGVARYARAVRARAGMTSIQVPVGSGLEISVFRP